MWGQGGAGNGVGEVGGRWEGWKGLSSSSWMLIWLGQDTSLCDGMLQQLPGVTQEMRPWSWSQGSHGAE